MHQILKAHGVHSLIFLSAWWVCSQSSTINQQSNWITSAEGIHALLLVVDSIYKLLYDHMLYYYACIT